MNRICKQAMDNRSEIFFKETAGVLEHNILDWWLKLRDPRGGFYGEVSSDGRISPVYVAACIQPYS